MPPPRPGLGSGAARGGECGGRALPAAGRRRGDAGMGRELLAGGRGAGSHLRPPLRPVPAARLGHSGPCAAFRQRCGCSRRGVAEGPGGGWENCLLRVLVGVTQSFSLSERLLGCGYTLGGEAKQKGVT